MSKSYFTRRLLEAIKSADKAETPEEREVHLRLSRHYHDLIRLPSRPHADRR